VGDVGLGEPAIEQLDDVSVDLSFDISSRAGGFRADLGTGSKCIGMFDREMGCVGLLNPVWPVGEALGLEQPTEQDGRPASGCADDSRKSGREPSHISIVVPRSTQLGLAEAATALETLMAGTRGKVVVRIGWSQS
jgi:hypothetical protein